MNKEIENRRQLLRDYVIAQRNALTQEELQSAARDMCLLLESTPEFHHSLHVAAYWPMRGEMDVRPVIEQSLRYNKHVYLPVVGANNTLQFAPYTKETATQKNRFGIVEPVVDDSELVSPRDLDLVITPLTVFDSHGQRLGMGGGFYDRTFAFLKDEPDRVAPCLVGAAHEFQHTSELPLHEWDVPLRLVVTEEQVWRPAAHHAESASG